jgi:hypothetical protein
MCERPSESRTPRTGGVSGVQLVRPRRKRLKAWALSDETAADRVAVPEEAGSYWGRSLPPLLQPDHEPSEYPVRIG